MSRLDHLQRLVVAYALGRQSHVSFWRELPAAHPRAAEPEGLFYPMTFADKADYEGPFDAAGVPLLDYHGSIGAQYNPIAVAQFALAWMNRELEGAPDARRRWTPSADWLVANLVRNRGGVEVWMHHFDWPYRETLRNPWYSGLAQGQGVSALLRAGRISGEGRYTEAAERAFRAIETPIGEGGVLYFDEAGDPWIEEYLVTPPSHILNGFLWALWGVHDMVKLGGSSTAGELFTRCIATVRRNLHRFDNGYWSLYEIRPSGMQMPTSAFYHSLHIVQLDITARLTGDPAFAEMATRWRGYADDRLKRTRALVAKALFKILYY